MYTVHERLQWTCGIKGIAHEGLQWTCGIKGIAMDV